MSKREGGMVVRKGREVERLHGDVLEPYPHVTVPAPATPVAHPIPSRPTDQRVVVEHHYHQAPVVAREPEVLAASKAIPWALIAVALCIVVFAIFTALNAMASPELRPIRPQQSIDLVNPSR